MITLAVCPHRATASLRWIIHQTVILDTDLGLFYFAEPAIVFSDLIARATLVVALARRRTGDSGVPQFIVMRTDFDI
jgi:hypothetical protein